MSELTDVKINEMIDLCEKMLEKSYCIYSKFPVAAVLITDCGKTITGKLTKIRDSRIFASLDMS